MNALNYSLLFLYLAIFSSCGSSDDPAESCGPEVVISGELFATANTELLDIINININEDCLELTMGSSGCDGERWEVNLIDAEVILESFPVQRNVIISIFNDEECDAYFMRDYFFDISDLRVEESGTVLLNISNTGEQVNYTY